jgi:hypothetical protein
MSFVYWKKSWDATIAPHIIEKKEIGDYLIYCSSYSKNHIFYTSRDPYIRISEYEKDYGLSQLKVRMVLLVKDAKNLVQLIKNNQETLDERSVQIVLTKYNDLIIGGYTSSESAVDDLTHKFKLM